MNQLPHWIRTSGVPNVSKPTRLTFAVDPAAGNIYYWDTDGAWILLGGGGGVSGAPRAIVFIDPSGTGANTDADLVVRPAALGNYGRPEIWDHRPPNPPSAGPVFRQGASSADADSFDSPGDGIVIYGPADNGIQDDTNFTFGRVKSNRFAIRFRQGLDIGDAWRTDTTEQYFKDNTGTRTMTITRATGDAYFGGYVTIQPTKSLDTNAAGILSLGTATATGIAMGYAAPNPLNDPMIFVNQGGVPLHSSNAGLQFSSARNNRAQFRGNQYSPDPRGFPGITGFKSRGATIGSLAPVVVGDGIFRATAMGVCPDLSTPLSGLMTFYVEGTYPTYIATSWEIELNPPEGPTNGHRPMFGVTANGIPCLREQDLVEVNRAAGIATLGPGGSVTIPNGAVTATSRFVLTVQDGGAAPTGMIYQSARTVGPGGDFTIKSSAGLADDGVQVYWQIWGQTAASRPF